MLHYKILHNIGYACKHHFLVNCFQNFIYPCRHKDDMKIYSTDTLT